MSGNHLSMALRLPAVCLFTVLMTIQTAAGQKWGKITDEEWNLVPPVEFPNAAAVVLFNNGELKITHENIVLEKHVRIKVFRKVGADDAAQVEIGVSDNDNLRELTAHTISPDGKKIKIKDRYEKKAGSYKIITFAFPGVEDGAILEYSYRNVHKRYFYLDPWYFQSHIPTLESRFSVVMYPYFQYRVSRTNVPPNAKEPQREDFKELGVDVTRFTWKLNNLPAAGDEPMMGARQTYAVSVHFQLVSYKSPYGSQTFTETWDELGKNLSLNHEFETFVSNKAKLAELASSLCAEASSPDDTIGSIFRFVRDKIETRDEGSKYLFELRKAESMLERGHGFSEEKNVLLARLLRSVGIMSYPLLIGTRGFSKFNPALVHISQFNHLVCYVECGERHMVLDAGDRLTTYPFLPAYDLVSGGLVVDGPSSRTVQFTPLERPSGSRIGCTVNVRDDGSAVCTMSVCLRGYEMAAYGGFLSDSLAQAGIVEKLLREAPMEYEVVSLSSHFDDDGDTLHFDVVLDLPQFAEVVGENLFLPSVVFPVELNPFDERDRFFPVDFRYKYDVHRTTTVNLPEGMEVADVPSDIDHRIGDGRYSRSSLLNVNSVHMIERFEVGKPMFAPGEYASLKGMFDMMTESSSDRIAVTVSR